MIVASSGDNVFTQAHSNLALTFTLSFAGPLDAFEFTRVFYRDGVNGSAFSHVCTDDWKLTRPDAAVPEPACAALALGGVGALVLGRRAGRPA